VATEKATPVATEKIFFCRSRSRPAKIVKAVHAKNLGNHGTVVAMYTIVLFPVDACMDLVGRIPWHSSLDSYSTLL
jgi:hypothetical protein